MKYNEIANGTIVKVHTGCCYNNNGTLNPKGFWGAWIPTIPIIDLNHKVLDKIVKERTFRVVDSNVCITTLEIVK